SGPAYPTLRVVLTGPSGEVVGVNQLDTYDDVAPFALPEPGTYTLSVTSYTTGTGAYSFRLLDLGAAPTLTLNATTSGTLNPGTTTDLFSFPGSAGQRIFINPVSGANGYVVLYGTAGQQITYTTLGGGGFQATLPVAGTYTVGVEGYASNTSPVSYSFQ